MNNPKEWSNRSIVRLSNRLKAITDYINKGDSVADIGTDHGLIPIYLVSEQICSKVIAGDLNRGPVEAARENVKAKGLQALVDVRLGFGLKILKPGEVDTVVIAGMGGGTIRDILTNGFSVVGLLKKLVLQPMNDEAVLREWLFQNEWHIEDEEMILDEGRLYTIIKALQGPAASYEPEDILFGPSLLTKKHPLLKGKMTKELEHKERIIAQVIDKASNNAEGQVERLKTEIEHYKKVLRWL